MPMSKQALRKELMVMVMAVVVAMVVVTPSKQPQR
jgi:hypothetical protein